MNSYERWLREEKQWIGEYQRKLMVMSILRVIPAALLILCALFGGLSYMDEGNALTGITAGLMLGILVSAVYLLFLVLGLRPGRYVSKIKSAVKGLQMEDWEKERLGQEMLEASEGSWRCVSYVLEGHGSSRTPARFRITPHYAFLEGSSPYAILVRLSDMGRIVPEEEQKTHTRRGAKTRVYETFTLYTIYFYAENGESIKQQPVNGMGFFEKEMRDRVMGLIRTQLAENQEAGQH